MTCDNHNELDQPIGPAVSHWDPCTLPSGTKMEGRYDLDVASIAPKASLLRRAGSDGERFHRWGSFVPFKFHSKGRHHIPRQRYRVTNWREYDAALRNRGSLTIWFSEKALAGWRAQPRNPPGGQRHYSNLAIETALTLRAVFRLALRLSEGLVGSIMRLLGIDLPVPDHTTLSRRACGLPVQRHQRAKTGELHLIVDSTGLKLRGAGEWLFAKHGTSKRRAWRKLHIGIDVDSGEIVAFDLTDKDVDDASHVETLLEQLAEAPASFMADGAYDRTAVRETVLARNLDAKFIVPPCKGAVSGPSAATSMTQRDRHVLWVEEHGRMNWQKASGYNKRSKIEAAISRYKRVIGDALKSRDDARRATEVAIAVKSLNRMREFGQDAPARCWTPQCNKASRRGDADWWRKRGDVNGVERRDCERRRRLR